MDVFCKKIREIERYIMNILTANNKIIMTEQDEQDFANATQCYICPIRNKAKRQRGLQSEGSLSYNG